MVKHSEDSALVPAAASLVDLLLWLMPLQGMCAGDRDQLLQCARARVRACVVPSFLRTTAIATVLASVAAGIVLALYM